VYGITEYFLLEKATEIFIGILNESKIFPTLEIETLSTIKVSTV